MIVRGPSFLRLARIPVIPDGAEEASGGGQHMPETSLEGDESGRNRSSIPDANGIWNRT